jgi:hypothetical protein
MERTFLLAGVGGYGGSSGRDGLREVEGGGGVLEGRPVLLEFEHGFAAVLGAFEFGGGAGEQEFVSKLRVGVWR